MLLSRARCVWHVKTQQQMWTNANTNRLELSTTDLTVVYTVSQKWHPFSFNNNKVKC